VRATGFASAGPRVDELASIRVEDERETEGAEGNCTRHWQSQWHPAIDGQVGQERIDFSLSHFQRMPLVVVKDEAAAPMEMGFLGTSRQMPHAPHDAP